MTDKQSPKTPEKASDKQKDKDKESRPRPGLLEPVLRFTPTAWAKLLYFRDRGQTEIGGFGVTDTDDPLLVTRFEPVLQDVSAVTISFDDEAVADFYDRMVDGGLMPRQFGRVWTHSHPGSSAHPSSTDEETFERVFGSCDWAIMFILSRSGKTYARLRHNTGPRSDRLLEVEVDYSSQFDASDHDSWQREFDNTIRPDKSQGLWDCDEIDQWMIGGAAPVDCELELELDMDIDSMSMASLGEMDGPERLYVLRELGLLQSPSPLEVGP
jgi:proteasome lid subunit RPN8/RPN11